MSRSAYSSTAHSQAKVLDIDEKHILRYLALEEAFSSDCLVAEKVKVKRLRNKDVRQASRTLEDATVHDPLAIYMRDTPDARHSRLYKRIERLQFALGTSQWVRRRWGLTVNHGRAVVCAQPAPETVQKTSLDKQIDELYRLLARALNFIGKSKEQRRRFEEIGKTLNNFVEETLGIHEREMRCVNALATAPDFQRHGYGGALVDAITKMADKEGRSTYLLSSNPINTEFYNAHGFFTIAETFIGADNPTWDRLPIPIPLMVRIYGDQ